MDFNIHFFHSINEYDDRRWFITECTSCSIGIDKHTNHFTIIPNDCRVYRCVTNCKFIINFSGSFNVCPFVSFCIEVLPLEGAFFSWCLPIHTSCQYFAFKCISRDCDWICTHHQFCRSRSPCLNFIWCDAIFIYFRFDDMNTNEFIFV